MKRGEVWWVNFDPSIGGEIQKERPAVILSNDASNKHLSPHRLLPVSARVNSVVMRATHAAKFTVSNKR